MCGILFYHNSSNKEFNKNLNENFIANLNYSSDVFYKFNDIEEYYEKQIFLRDSTLDHLAPFIACRGPSLCSFRRLKNIDACWFSAVLSLREPLCEQSVLIEGRYVLQFNGELYNDEIQDNDTAFIVNLLKETDQTRAGIIKIVKRLEGEFAFTIYDLINKKVYFGRDPIGKRSLCYQLKKDDEDSKDKTSLCVSNISASIEGFIDCDAGYIYEYNILMKQLEILDDCHITYNVTDKSDAEFKLLDNTVEELYKSLYLATKKRVLSIHPLHVENSPISVLFSGGLDCTVLVALICEVFRNEKDKFNNGLIRIELLNVGFENPRTGMLPHQTPDRQLGISSAKTLKNLFPDIDIRLIEIDVPYEEYLKARPVVIDLMYPKETEMDLSIAIAFYFASKGKGHWTDEKNNSIRPYDRKGLVLFSGLGADELYGGYHKFANKSPDELVEELARQINNIHSRNLNRDDKVIAHNGVEVRYPYLDHNVIKYSTIEIPISYKTNKLILRKLALDKLKLIEISKEPKRAIQFGSKSAKMTKDGNKHGTDKLK